MENNKEVLVLNLPNLENEDIMKVTEQLVFQSKNLMDRYRIENKNIILDIEIKRE